MQVIDPSLTEMVEATAARLRLVQLDFGDESPQARRDYLASEVRQALERVPKPQQESFLAALGERFPAFGTGGFAEPAPQIAVQPEPQPPREMTPAELFAELAVKGKALPFNQRQAMLKQLQQAWGIPAEVAPAPIQQPRAPRPEAKPEPRPEPPPTPVVVQQHAMAAGVTETPSSVVAVVAQRLGITNTAAVEPAAVGQLTVQLLDFALPLHPLVTRIWKNIAGRSELADRPLQQSMQSFVQGKNPDLSADLLQLRALIAALINAMPHLAEGFCDHHLMRFQPSEIEEAVRTEKSFVLWGGDNKLWAKYKQMAPLLESPAVGDAIRTVIRDLVGTAIQATSLKPREIEQ